MLRNSLLLDRDESASTHCDKNVLGSVLELPVGSMWICLYVSLYSEASGVGVMFRKQYRKRSKQIKRRFASAYVPFQSLLELIILQSTKDIRKNMCKPLRHFLTVARECTHVARCTAYARLQRHKDNYSTRQSPRIFLLLKYIGIMDAFGDHIVCRSPAVATSGDGSISPIALIPTCASLF